MMTTLLIVSLAGCGAGQKETVESTAPATMTETVAASQVETAEAIETETTVQEDRASRIKAYQAALENIYQNHILPDGSELRDDISGEMSGNKFAVYDVDHDGREELVFCYTATSMASMTAKIYDYDEASGELYEELSQFPMLTFYDNATIGAGISHNQAMPVSSGRIRFILMMQPMTAIGPNTLSMPGINLYPMSIITGSLPG